MPGQSLPLPQPNTREKNHRVGQRCGIERNAVKNGTKDFCRTKRSENQHRSNRRVMPQPPCQQRKQQIELHDESEKPPDRNESPKSLGQVALEDTDIGLYMLEHGLAWTYRNYLSSMRSDWRNAYIAAEQKAREDGVGLWQSEQPVPPWTWRKQKRDQERALEESQLPEDTLSSVNKELIEKFDNLKDVIAQGEQERPDGKTERGNVEKKVTYWQLCSDLGQAAARWIVTVIKSIFF